MVKTSEDGEILEKAEIFDYAQVQRMIAMRKAREAAKQRYEKELRKKRGVVLEESEDKDEDAKSQTGRAGKFRSHSEKTRGARVPGRRRRVLRREHHFQRRRKRR